MRQSTETEGCIRLRAFFLYDLVSGSPFFGVWVLLVEFGTLESSGDDFVRGANAWLDLDTLSADSVRYFSLFSRN